MDLGNSCLKRNGINLLTESIHPRHGLAWSDGRCIYLSPVKLHSAQVENEVSLKLGEFQCIQSVHWGSVFELRWCYLCVVHGQSVSIWKVEGDVPKLSFKQVRKINATPISQGCLWNPSRDLLCIIGQQQCTFYYNHITEKGSYAFPHLDRGKFTCGAWNKDGTKLILAYGTVIVIYFWQDIDKFITQVQTDSWKIPGLDGKISAMVSMGVDTFVLSAELPLDQLCRVENSFVMPDLGVGGSVGGSDDVIRPSQPSFTNSLLNPQRENTGLQDSSQTVVVDVSQREDATRVVARGSVKELLSPDLIMYDNQSHCIIVGSNAQCSLQIFKIVERNIVKIGNIILDKEVRPKGLAPIPRLSQKYCTGCLVLLGRRADSDRTFLPSAQGVHYKLSLHFFALPENEESRRRSLCRRRDASLQGYQPRHVSPAPSKNRQRANIRSASFLKSDYQTIRSTGHTLILAHAECSEDDDVTVGSIAEDKHAEFTTKSSSENVIPKSQSADSLQRGSTGRPHGFKQDTTRGERSKSIQIEPRSATLEAYRRSQPNRQSAPQIVYDPQAINQQMFSGGDLNRSFESCTSDSSSSIISPRTDFYTEAHVTLDDNHNVTTKDAETGDEDAGIEYSLNDISQKLDERRSSITDTRRASEYRRDGITRNRDKRCSDYAHAVITHSQPIAPSRRKKQPITDLDSSGSSTDLEITRVEFADQTPNFARNDLRKLNDRVLGSSGIESTCENIADVGKTGMKVMEYSSSSTEDSQKDSVTYRRCINPGSDEAKAETIDLTSITVSETLGEESMDTKSGDVTDLLDSQEIFLQDQEKQISDLRERLENLTKTVDKTTCVFPSSYQTSLHPDVVHLECVALDPLATRKTFLLDNGRLKLDVVQKAFGLDYVELIFDDDPVVIGSNIDGYIPYRFEPMSTWKISGLKSHPIEQQPVLSVSQQSISGQHELTSEQHERISGSQTDVSGSQPIIYGLQLDPSAEYPDIARSQPNLRITPQNLPETADNISKSQPNISVTKPKPTGLRKNVSDLRSKISSALSDKQQPNFSNTDVSVTTTYTTERQSHNEEVSLC